MKILLYNPDNGVTRNFMPRLWMSCRWLVTQESLIPSSRPVALLVVAVLATGAATARPFERAATPAPAWQSRLFSNELAPEPAKEPAKEPDGKTERQPVCSDPAARTQLSRCFPHLFVHDAALVFSAPARWKARDWGLFSAGVIGVGALFAVDDDVRTAVLRSDKGFHDKVARTFEPFGTWASFAVIGGFYFGGLAAHDDKARGVAADAVVASIISGVIVTPVLKKVFGRSRPNAGQGPHDFDPFQGGASFPSGHATQAFAVASVIATEYPNPWVQVACYVPATLVLYARMRHDAHWASDVMAGALIGYGVGRQVATFNHPLRVGKHQVQLLPLFAPKTFGVVFNVRS